MYLLNYLNRDRLSFQKEKSSSEFNWIISSESDVPAIDSSLTKEPVIKNIESDLS